MYRGKIKRIHFVGIGGAGMNGIAEVLINMGYEVTGSDIAASETTKRLSGLGAVIHIGHRAENVTGAHCVVYSSAISKDNPELAAAAAFQIPIIPRAEMLAELMRMKFGIAIAGTHGKTTTTSMVSSILGVAGIDPTVVTGGKLNNLGANARLGKSEFLVAEADESDGSFLKLSPTIAVVTNIDREHMDHYNSMDDVFAAYLDFMNKVPFYGCAVICLDHPALQRLIPDITRRFVSFGLSAQADVHAGSVKCRGVESSFDLFYGGASLGRVTIKLPGEHNVYNALGAVAVARELNIGFEKIKEGLEEFTGVERRFHIRGVAGGVTVVDDYGHHPEEIKAVLKTAKNCFDGRVVAVFQPHRFSRTVDLFEEFLSSFNDADKLVLTGIYPAGEERMEGVSGESLYRAIKEHGHKDITYIEDVEKVPAYLDGVAERGDTVITLGAGNVWKAGVGLVERLKKRRGSENLRIV
ncbi:MAG: UDP-N-acetylmuramate--L-alanine ligase [Thermodesulfobacteriota bacterium]